MTHQTLSYTLLFRRYLGDITKLLNNFARLSHTSGKEGSYLIFSCERIEEDGATWRLQKSGRYAHSKTYVIESAANAGYKLVGYDEITPRYEKGVAVKGHLFRFSLIGRGEESKDEL